LMQLNDPLFVASAKSLAAKIVRKNTDQAQRLRYAFRRCLGRNLTPREQRSLSALHKRLLVIYQADPKAALELTESGQRDVALAIRWAAWTMVVRTILNLDEFVTRE